MYYVLRTHGSIKSHWGLTAIASYDTKKAAKAHCDKHFKENPSADKLIVAKALSFYELTDWNAKENALC